MILPSYRLESHENAWHSCPFSTIEKDLSHDSYPSPICFQILDSTWWFLFVFNKIPKVWRDQKLMAVIITVIEFKIEELCTFCDFCIITWKPWMDIQLLDTTSWRERFFESNLCQSMPGGMRSLVFSPVKRTTSVRLKPSEPWGVRR